MNMNMEMPQENIESQSINKFETIADDAKKVESGEKSLDKDLILNIEEQLKSEGITKDQRTELEYFRDMLPNIDVENMMNYAQALKEEGDIEGAKELCREAESRFKDYENENWLSEESVVDLLRGFNSLKDILNS